MEKFLKNKKVLTILSVIVAIFLGFKLLTGVGDFLSLFGSGYSAGQSSDSMYITAAKEILETGVKTAGSPIFNRYKTFANYNDAKIYEKDDYGRAIVYIEVTAVAGDESRREEYYVFINDMTSDGQYSYDKTFHATSNIAMLDMFKSANDFGEPQ